MKAGDEWIYLKSPHLEAISDAGVQRTRDVIESLERFRHVMSQIFSLPDLERLPVTVFVFKNDSSFEPYKPLYAGRPANVSGFFNRGRDRNIIALDARSEWNPLQVIQHEYLHLITSYRRHPWPLWLSEGLAELYSTFSISSKWATVGKPIPTHFEMIRQRGFYPMEDLLRFDRSSSVYNEREKQGVFYAQSWLLIHYLMLGEDRRNQALLGHFLDLLDAGMDSVEAFSRVFPHLPLEELGKSLRQYARKPSFRILRYPLEEMAPDPDIHIRRLRTGAALAHLGDLLLQVDRFQAASEHFRRAMALVPQSPHPYEGLALLARHHGNAEEARRHVESAIERNSKSPRLYSQWAEDRMRDLGLLERHRRGLDPEQLDPIEASIRESIQLAPGFDRSYYLLATLCLRTGRKLDQGLESIRTALTLEPQNEYYRLTLADLQLESNDHQGAEQTLMELEAAVDSEIRQHATARLEYLRNLRQMTPWKRR